jgi:hypothetical protein
LENLQRTFHRLRHNDIDEELFDVISGFEALRLTPSSTSSHGTASVRQRTESRVHA